MSERRTRKVLTQSLSPSFLQALSIKTPHLANPVRRKIHLQKQKTKWFSSHMQRMSWKHTRRHKHQRKGEYVIHTNSLRIFKAKVERKYAYLVRLLDHMFPLFCSAHIIAVADKIMLTHTHIHPHKERERGQRQNRRKIVMDSNKTEVDPLPPPPPFLPSRSSPPLCPPLLYHTIIYLPHHLHLGRFTRVMGGKSRGEKRLSEMERGGWEGDSVGRCGGDEGKCIVGV